METTQIQVEEPSNYRVDSDLQAIFVILSVIGLIAALVYYTKMATAASKIAQQNNSEKK